MTLVMVNRLPRTQDLGLVWEFMKEEKRKEKIAQERKEEKGKDAYFVWEFNERKEKKYLSLI